MIPHTCCCLTVKSLFQIHDSAVLQTTDPTYYRYCVFYNKIHDCEVSLLMFAVYKCQQNTELLMSLPIMQWSQNLERIQWEEVHPWLLQSLSPNYEEDFPGTLQVYQVLFDWKHNWLNLGLKVCEWVRKKLKRILSDFIEEILPMENTFLFLPLWEAYICTSYFQQCWLCQE